MSNEVFSQSEIDQLLSPSTEPTREEREMEELSAFRDRFWSSGAGAPADLPEDARRRAWRVLEESIALNRQAGRLGLLSVGPDLEARRSEPHEEPDYFLEWCHRVVGLGREPGIGPDELTELVDAQMADSTPEEIPLVVVSALGARVLMQGFLAETLVAVARPVFALRFAKPAGEVVGEGSAVAPAIARANEAGALETAPVSVEGPGDITYDHDRVGFWRGEFPLPRQSASDPDLWYMVDTNMAFLRFDSSTGMLRDVTLLDGAVAPDLPQLRHGWQSTGPTSCVYHEDEDRLFSARPTFALPGAVTAETTDDEMPRGSWYLEAWEPSSPRLLWRMETEGVPRILEARDGGRVRIGIDNVGVLEVADGAVASRIPLEGCGRIVGEARHWREYAVYGMSAGLLFVSQEGGEHHFVPFPDGLRLDIISVGVRDDAIIVTSFERHILRLAGEGLPWDGWRFARFSRFFFLAVSPEADWAVGFTTRDRSEDGVWFDRRRFFPKGEMTHITWAVGSPLDPETAWAEYGPATTTPGMPVIPRALRAGRLSVSMASHRAEVLYHGLNDGELSRARAQEFPLRPLRALADADGQCAAVYGGVQGRIRILDAHGTTIAESSEAFAMIEELFDLDPERGSVQVFGRSSDAVVKMGENPRQETWRWYWREDSWERTGYPFEGIAYPFDAEPQVFFRETTDPLLVGGDPGHEPKLRTDLRFGSIWALGADITRLDVFTRTEERFPVHLTAYGLSWQRADALFDPVGFRCWVLGRDGELLAFDIAAGDLLWHGRVLMEGGAPMGRLSLLGGAAGRGPAAAGGENPTLAVRSDAGIELFDAERGSHLGRLVADESTGPVTSTAFELGGRVYAYAGAALVGWG